MVLQFAHETGHGQSRPFESRLACAVLALAMAALAAGCVSSTYTVALENDTANAVIVHPLSLQSRKSFTLAPGQETLRSLSNDTLELRLSTANGAKLGCLRPTRYGRGDLIFFSVPDRVSQAHSSCPGETVFDAFQLYLRVLMSIPALPLVFGPLGAAIWLLVWARRRPRRVRLVSALESLGLCGLSAVILLLLVRWGSP